MPQTEPNLGFILIGGCTNMPLRLNHERQTHHLYVWQAEQASSRHGRDGYDVSKCIIFTRLSRRTCSSEAGIYLRWLIRWNKSQAVNQIQHAARLKTELQKSLWIGTMSFVRGATINFSTLTETGLYAVSLMRIGVRRPRQKRAA